ncbi:hypothetical protein NMY22_g1655 [Coprinellus aureogranulatus]|nr:hypothetical protein NMY22_g1655 [Coprinellus aureogranulatus]
MQDIRRQLQTGVIGFLTKKQQWVHTLFLAVSHTLAKPSIRMSTEPSALPAQRKAKRRRAIKRSRYLWHSGWELSPPDFIKFVRSVPNMRPPGEDKGEPRQDDTMRYYRAYKKRYDRFVGRKAAFKPSRLRVREKPERRDDGVTVYHDIGYFFALRSIEYRNHRQAEDGHPDAARIKTPSDNDWARLFAFVQHLVEKENAKFNNITPYFTCMKALRPQLDRYYLSLPKPTQEDMDLLWE